jgi:arylsulfatase A-like enzyme
MPQLRVVRRLLDDGFRTAMPPFTHKGVESIAGVRKLAVAAVTSIHPSTVCMPPTESASPRRPCTVTVPRSESSVPALIVETESLPLLRAWTKRGEAPRQLRARGDLGRRRRFVVRRQPLDGAPAARNLPIWMTPQLRGWPALGVRVRDMFSHPMGIPPEAVLTFAVGIQEPAWYVDSAPVQFRVIALSPEGNVEVYRRDLDPARRPEDRHWIDERVSLGAVAGRTVTLLFRVRPLDPADPRPQLPVWADPTLLAPRAVPGPPMPGIVLVSLDTLRAKSMSVYGYEARETTPWFSRFAASATRFARAYTTYSNTFGAHVSMLTGTYPGRHTVRGALRLAPDIPTLAERLRAGGYETAAFTEDALLDASAGFARGFAHYWENKTVEVGAGDAPGTFGRALAWLRAHRDQTFFLFVHTYAVHSPYRPSPPYDTFFVDTAQVCTSIDQLAYEREIRQLDDDVARLVAGLDALIPPDRFVLVVTADHGEQFGEHGGALHTHLYDEVLHVPLFVRWPGSVPAGRTLDAQVSLIDVAPTLLDLVGLDPTGGDGQTLRPLLEGTTKALDREVVLAASPPSIFSGHTWKFAARRSDAKCFSYDLASLDCCFDLSRDPDERHPLAPTGAYDALWKTARAHGEAFFAGPARAAKAPEAFDVDAERVRKLHALGYLE